MRFPVALFVFAVALNTALCGAAWAEDAAAVPAGAAPAPKTATLRLVVLDVHGLEQAAQTAKSLTPVVVQELARTGMFALVSREEIARLLEHAADKQALGCAVEAECLVELGQALQADKLVAGSLGRLGGTYVLTLQLLDVKAARVDKRVERSLSGAADGLLNEARSATRQLVSELLAERAGTLTVQGTEKGADVFLDDVLIGTTPLPAFQLAGGWHRIRVEKRGFVPFARDWRVTPHEAATLPYALVPSAEFIAAYTRKAKTYRGLAYGFSALALASLGTAIGLEVWNDHRYRNDYRPRRRAYLADPQGAAAGERDSINALGRSIDRVGVAWACMYALAGASTGLALYFFLDGDDPQRYARSANEKGDASALPSVGVAPSSRGVWLSGSWRF